MFKKTTVSLILMFCVSTLISCGGSSPAHDGMPADTVAPGDDSLLNNDTSTGWPVAFPVDVVQPWEELSSDGFVLPAGDTRSGSSINLDTDFTPGVERYDQGGSVADEGEASRLTSGSAGSGDVSYAQYRIPLVGLQPGVIAADINLRPRSDGTASEYWLALSNYTLDTWDWHGPFNDAHVRVQPGAGEFISTLGNTFVTVAAFDGSDFDIVGIGLNPIDPADSLPPDPPVLNAVLSVNGGLLLEILHPGAADLAGFQVYHAPSTFTDSSDPVVSAVDYLIGEGRFHLQGLTANTFVRISAVDFSGNESVLSAVFDAPPLGGAVPNVQLETDLISGLIGDSMNLVVTGADEYNWDLDGDGVFEVLADLTGSQTVAPNTVGIIRPAVRGSASGGDAIGYGAVSLLIGTNARPVAQGFAEPANGPAPLAVTFTSLSSDFDGTIVRWGWDFDGDKTYDYTTMDPLLINPPPHTYVDPGTYNAKFRAWDDGGSWDVDTVAINVSGFQGFGWVITDDLPGTGNHVSTAIIDGHPAMAYRAAPADDGIMFCRANDPHGTTWEEPHHILHSAGAGWYISLAEVDGRPAVSYWTSATNRVWFMNASDAHGTMWNLPTQLDTKSMDSRTSLAVIDGNPAVAYADSILQNLYYVRADSVDGDTWGNPPVNIDSTAVTGYPDLVDVGGNPAIAYNRGTDIYYVRSTTINGMLPGDWATPVNVSDSSAGSGPIGLVVVNGNPALAYSDSGLHSMVYTRATTATGALDGDWPAAPIEIDNGSSGLNCDMAIINGYPALCYEKNVVFQRVMYCQAADFNGTTWQVPRIAHYIPTQTTGIYSNLVQAGGGPGIGCRSSSMDVPLFIHPLFY